MALTTDEKIKNLAILEREYVNMIMDPKCEPSNTLFLQTMISKLKIQLHGPENSLSHLFPTGTKDIDLLIFNQLDDDSLFAVCLVNRYTGELSQFEPFWIKKLNKRYKVDLGPYLRERNIKRIYKNLVEHEKNSVKEDEEDPHPYDYLRYIIENGLLPLAKSFLNPDSYNVHFLASAVESGNLEMVKIVHNLHLHCISSDQDALYSDPYPRAVIKALNKSYPRITNYLVENGYKGKCWHIAAKIYITRNKPIMLNYLLENHPKTVAINDGTILSLLKVAVDDDSSPECLRILCQRVSNLAGFVKKYNGEFDVPGMLTKRLNIDQREYLSKQRAGFLSRGATKPRRTIDSDSEEGPRKRIKICEESDSDSEEKPRKRTKIREESDSDDEQVRKPKKFTKKPPPSECADD